MISRPKIALRLAFLICLVALVNFWAGKFFWYDAIWWFDMPMHFLGGVVISFLLAYLFYSFLIKKEATQSVIFLIFGVIVVGIGWEVFEYIFKNVIAGQFFNTLDTISDVCFDLAGGAAGIFLVKNKI